MLINWKNIELIYLNVSQCNKGIKRNCLGFIIPTHVTKISYLFYFNVSCLQISIVALYILRSKISFEPSVDSDSYKSKCSSYEWFFIFDSFSLLVPQVAESISCLSRASISCWGSTFASNNLWVFSITHTIMSVHSCWNSNRKTNQKIVKTKNKFKCLGHSIGS